MKGVNALMLRAALDACKEVKAAGVLLFLDAAEDWGFFKAVPDKKSIIIVTRRTEADAEIGRYAKDAMAVVRLPEVRLTRLGQVKLSIIIGLAEGALRNEDRVVCLTGVSGRGIIDTMLVLDLARETEVFAARGISKGLLKRIKPHVLESVLTLAIELAGEGREGKAIGTTFVIGDHERVSKLSKPLIMNPFKGYPEESRNILDASVHETIKEFSLLDGAFIIRDDGCVMAAGVHLDAALEDEGLTPGLGCRHMAAAGITDVTDAAAITISGSTGIVRIFRKGKTVLELERPGG
ncbi:MAG: DNA integrity scanning protein DisA nucleotide-binding domain protein [Deltaproteobacteria bacterium]|nr:DNA integrity scanning protein DisA nucleotide-binding domain protein [Deltaproteobacteria bacterium]